MKPYTVLRMLPLLVMAVTALLGAKPAAAEQGAMTHVTIQRGTTIAEIDVDWDTAINLAKLAQERGLEPYQVEVTRRGVLIVAPPTALDPRTLNPGKSFAFISAAPAEDSIATRAGRRFRGGAKLAAVAFEIDGPGPDGDPGGRRPQTIYRSMGTDQIWGKLQHVFKEFILGQCMSEGSGDSSGGGSSPGGGGGGGGNGGGGGGAPGGGGGGGGNGGQGGHSVTINGNVQGDVHVGCSHPQ